MASNIYVADEWMERAILIFGRSRYGKTNLVNFLVAQWMWQNMGLTYCEPHGDAIEETLGRVPPWRIKDVYLWDPSRADSLDMNLLALPYDEAKLTGHIVNFLKKMFLDSWGNRMEHILRHCLFLLITDIRDHNKLHSFKDVHRLLTEEDYRAPIIARTKRASEAAFWGEDGEFDRLPTTALDPILNKIGSLFLSGSITERIFSATGNDIDIPYIMNTGKILLVSLPKGKLGEDVSAFLGAIVVESITQAAYARVSIPPLLRVPHKAVLDEFQSFATPTFKEILSETGKMRLSIVMSFQLLDQLPSGLEAVVFANTPTVCVFHPYERDAAKICREMKASRTWVRERERGEEKSFEETREEVEGWLREKYLEYDNMRLGSDIAGQYQARRIRDDVYKALKSVLSLNITPKALDEIVHKEFGGKLKDGGVRFFDDMEFRTEVYPSADDLLNLGRFEAFLRVDLASNVKKISTVPCPPPNPQIAEAVLKHQAERKRKKEAKAAKMAPEKESEEMPTAPSNPEPDHPDDYWQK